MKASSGFKVTLPPPLSRIYSRFIGCVVLILDNNYFFFRLFLSSVLSAVQVKHLNISFNFDPSSK